MTSGIINTGKSLVPPSMAAMQSLPPRNAIRKRRFWRIIACGSGLGQAHGFLRAWSAWERLSNRLWPAQPILHAPYGLFRVRPIRYRGAPLSLPDDTVVSSGDLVGELHCDNAAIVNLIARGGINRYRACRRDLEGLARWLLEDQAGSPIKAFYGITMLRWAAARLGFAVRERRRPTRNRFDRIFMAGLLLIYSTDGPQRASRGRTLDYYPHEVWLSRAELMRRYAPSPVELKRSPTPQTADRP
jgi:hypothetical protein